MQKSSGTKIVESRKQGGNKELEKRQSEATSKETLSDLEESEKVPDPKPTRGADESSIPSPDGTADEGRQDNDGSGPM
jgi:hypothetical protein